MLSKPIPKGLALTSCSILALMISQSAVAGGLGVTIQSATGAGNAATGHALAEDASALWYNPALMMMVDEKHHINGGVAILSNDTTITNSQSSFPGGLFPIVGENEAEPGGISATPSMYYIRPLKSGSMFGLGINVPFGVSTEYDADSFTRYEATESALKTININPSLAWKVSDQLNLGIGANIQYGHALLEKKIDAYAVCFANAGAACDNLLPRSDPDFDSTASVEADGVSFGLNAGLTFKPNDKTSLSLAYRSQIKHELEGKTDLNINPRLSAFLTAAVGETALVDNGLIDQDASSKLTMPASASFSGAYEINNKLTVHGDLTWTEWSKIPEIRIDNALLPDSVTNLQWEDTLRIGAGATYQLNDRTKLRAGIAHDPSPTPGPQNRTPRAPSSDNLWISVGASHQINNKFSLDAGLSLIKPDTATIDYLAPDGYYTGANIDSNVWAGAVSVNYNF